MTGLADLRDRILARHLADETALVRDLIRDTGLTAEDRRAIDARAKELVIAVRNSPDRGLMESFLAKFPLSTAEGTGLMSLAEALLRVPDGETARLLTSDKLTGRSWTGSGRASSPLVDLSASALALSAAVLEPASPGPAGPLKELVRRVGEPVVSAGTTQAIRFVGNEFVFSQTIEDAIRGADDLSASGHRFSFDMLGEGARTAADAKRYFESYTHAIETLAKHCRPGPVAENPAISVKLSALHPRYEYPQRARVLAELVPRVVALARMAKAAAMGFTIDAEESERLILSLDVIEQALADPSLAGWDGFGVVVQAYGKRALPVIDWLATLAAAGNRRIGVRLVKGAYWDSEIKRAQTLGLRSFPVFTRKAATDVSYIAAARRLVDAGAHIYPQFATHNAHTVAAVLHLATARGKGSGDFEFQRLHGMGEQLHAALAHERGHHARIYAPVGSHTDLLPYLARRMLENGANGAFVQKIMDPRVEVDAVVADPIAALEAVTGDLTHPAIAPPPALFAPSRVNSAGWDLSDLLDLARIERARDPFHRHRWTAAPAGAGDETAAEVVNPAIAGDTVGTVATATAAQAADAVTRAAAAFPAWADRPASDRAAILRRVADAYEAHAGELFALLAREAGKTLPDCVSEVREAVDFLRYYPAEMETRHATARPRGVFVCISPWNFPLAIFTGQIAAALVAGNAVVAKPAEATPLVAARAVALIHAAGVPADVLQLVPGAGGVVGQALVSDARVAGVCFTGSLATAQRINRAMAANLRPDAPFIAETGGINAMIVDSTALPEQAVRDVVASAFQSAGQRCSALRILYLQEDIAEHTLAMLKGAIDGLVLGDPWDPATDVGPVISEPAAAGIRAYIERHRAAGRLLHQHPARPGGTFVPPTVIAVDGIEDLKEEVFGPVLHVATFRAEAFDDVVARINASGFGLTFGLHTRIDARARGLAERVHAGNIYVNRNQIGAVVGSQPFGGEGLSGTGPKAGGPNYLPRFLSDPVDVDILARHAPEKLPGPVGESNTLSYHPRGTVLCLGPSNVDAAAQVRIVTDAGDRPLVPALGANVEAMVASASIDAIACFGDEAMLRRVRIAASLRDGAIVPVAASAGVLARLAVERHVCVDTTAGGGNAALMAAMGEAA